MNKIIKEQLKKCKVAEIPKYTDSTYHLIIPSKRRAEQCLKVGGCYLIQLADYIIHPYEGFTLADNWNKGIVPKEEYIRANVVRTFGKMIQINGKGVNDSNTKILSEYKELWLPSKGIKIIKEI